MRVLAVDPGGTTGFVVWDNRDGPKLIDWAAVSPEEFFDFLDEIVDVHFNAIVCERYTVTANTLSKSRQYDALELIGVLRREAYQRRIPFVLQPQNPPYCTPARLKLCGLYVPNDHGRSAARQLLLYLVNQDIDPGASLEELLNAEG